MTDFIVSITDPAALAGITWAREQYNASLPPPPIPPDTVVGGMAMPVPGPRPEGLEPGPRVEGLEPGPQSQATLDTDEAYVQWVMETAAGSYAVQKEQAEWRAAYEAAQQPPAMQRRAAPNGGTRQRAPARPPASAQGKGDATDV